MRLDSFSLANGKSWHTPRNIFFFNYYYHYFIFLVNFLGDVLSRCFRLRSLPFPPFAIRISNNLIFRYHFEIYEMRTAVLRVRDF